MAARPALPDTSGLVPGAVLGGGVDVPWHLRRRDGDLWGLAGLYNGWTDPVTGEIVPSYTMLTLNCDGHPLLSPMHKPTLTQPCPCSCPGSPLARWPGHSTRSSSTPTWPPTPAGTTRARSGSLLGRQARLPVHGRPDGRPRLRRDRESDQPARPVLRRQGRGRQGHHEGQAPLWRPRP